jgi:hypothetical protein
MAKHWGSSGVPLDGKWMHDRVYRRDIALLKQLRERLAAAQAAAQAGRPGEAVRALGELPALSANDPVLKEARALRQRIEAEFATGLAAARKFAEGGAFAAAISAYETLAGKYAGLSGAEQAAKDLSALRSDPQAKAALEKAQKAEEARQRLAAARRLEAAKDNGGALRAYELIAAEHAGTAAGDEAAAEAKRIRGNTELMKRIELADSSREAQRLFQKAQNFLRNGMKDQAKENLKELLARYPGTPAAREAEELLRRGL